MTAVGILGEVAVRRSVVVTLAAVPLVVAPAVGSAEVGDTTLRRLVDARPPEVVAASAQGGGNAMFVTFEGGRHRGYRWALIAYKPRPQARTLLAIRFARSAGRQTQHQVSDFGWKLGPRALRTGPQLRRSALETGTGMGSNGRVSMELAPRSEYLRGTPQGCTGSIEYRVGRFRGKLRVHARDLFFKRISLDEATAVVYREHDLSCPGTTPPPSCPPHLLLAAEDPEAGVAIVVSRTEEGRVGQQVVVTRRSGDADGVHRIAVEIALPDAFVASDDLTSASVDGDVAGPWLSGDLSYLAPPPAVQATDETCGAYESTTGVVTGDFTAHFDSIGDVTPAATGMQATLQRDAS